VPTSRDPPTRAARVGTLFLIHAEHGATGIAAGTYLIRRQRRAGAVHNWSPGFRSIEFVAD
jgi:hypothetical protein